jgi:hypothetical protein
MATAKLKRKPRLSKTGSYKAANTKEVDFRLKFRVRKEVGSVVTKVCLSMNKFLRTTD